MNEVHSNIPIKCWFTTSTKCYIQIKYFWAKPNYKFQAVYFPHVLIYENLWRFNSLSNMEQVNVIINCKLYINLFCNTIEIIKWLTSFLWSASYFVDSRNIFLKFRYEIKNVLFVLPVSFHVLDQPTRGKGVKAQPCC